IPDGVRPVVVGELDVLRATAESLGLSVAFAAEEVATAQETPMRSLGLLRTGSFRVGEISAACGDAAFRYFAHAIEECLADRAHAIVTAPLHKEAMNLAGHAFAGHTELLEKMTGIEGPAMALWLPKVGMAHVTEHLPLRAARDAHRVERVMHAARLSHAALASAGFAAPRIALAGVNPHAGENGLFGREELDILRPAMERLAAEGIATAGPHPGDTVFLQA